MEMLASINKDPLSARHSVPFFYFITVTGSFCLHQYAAESATNKQCAPADPVITVNKFNTWV